MAGASISIDYSFPDKAIAARLRALVDAGEDLEPAFIDIGEGLLNSTHDRWDQQVDPEGNPWEPLDPKYQARKKKNADKVLVLEGFMRDTLAYNTSSQSMEMGTNLIQGATHQFGDDDRGIPARPYLGVSEDDEQMIIDTLHDHFQEALG
ncbi:phage virion morphogenesis protein [Methylophaga thiooxydans]|uniref:phage virion morphogenesis protein n=1 Tax=Methylophaga thiooxydans TaxID=392484 RepID=UPI00235563D6|nr:phage virion morphogenesis protein [Methylophaga thiooxydans]